MSGRRGIYGMKNAHNWLQRFQRTRFSKVLTLLMSGLFCVIFLCFSVTVTGLSENIIRQNVEKNMSLVVNQYDVYLNNYITSIYNGYRSLESDQNLVQFRTTWGNDSTLSRRAMLHLYFGKLVTQFQSANATSVSHIYINFGDGLFSTQVYDKDPMHIKYSYEAWRERFPENQYYWVNADSCRDLIPDEDIGVVLFHMYGGSTPSEQGIILVALKQSFFEDVLDSTRFDPDADVCLLTDTGAMHFGSEEAAQQIDAHASRLEETAVGEISSEVWDGYYFSYKTMPITNWILVYSVRDSNISSAHFIIKNVILLTIAGVVIAAILITLLSYAVSYPLKQLTDRVEAKDVLDREISITSYQEITKLSNGLETMRTHINDLLEQVKMEQETKRQIEIALLQEQINPHFLYNTLYSIMKLCEMGRDEQAAKMLGALSGFYRIGLSHGKSIVTVAEELEHIKNYLYIQHFRYADLFDYSIDCEPEILDCEIPKMSLQPLVENAIYHGIKENRSFCNLAILGGTYDDEYAYLEVHDDGAGFTEERLADIREQLKTGKAQGKVSFGMKNVDARIKYEFGQDCGIQIESTPTDTCVRIRFLMRSTTEGIDAEV